MQPAQVFEESRPSDHLMRVAAGYIAGGAADEFLGHLARGAADEFLGHLASRPFFASMTLFIVTATL